MIEQRRKLARLVADHGQVFSSLTGEALVLKKQFGKSHDARKRRAELMRHFSDGSFEVRGLILHGDRVVG